MSTATTASATTAPTEFLRAKDETYAYRRVGGGYPTASALSATFHRHIGQLGSRRDGSARRRAGSHSVRQRWSRTVNRQGADHGSRNGSACLAFLDGLCVTSCDVLGFSLGGMVAQQMALDRPSSIHRMILVGTAPRGGEDIMHLEKPSLARHLGDPDSQGIRRVAEDLLRADVVEPGGRRRVH